MCSLADRRSSIEKGYLASMADSTSTDDLFDTSTILPSDPVGDDGEPLEVLHDREYRVRAFRRRDDLLLVRGAVRDQKPPGLYIEIDPEPMTIHHMQIDLEIAFPTLEIVGRDGRDRDASERIVSEHRGPLRQARRVVDRPWLHAQGARPVRWTPRVHPHDGAATGDGAGGDPMHVVDAGVAGQARLDGAVAVARTAQHGLAVQPEHVPRVGRGR